MGTLKSPNRSSSDKQKWNKIFNALVHMLQTLQTQLESLAKDRKLLEDRIKLQYDRWASDVSLFKEQISQMKRDFTIKDMERVAEAAKSDLFIGLKQRDAEMYKLNLENADSELADFKLWFDLLSRKCSEPKVIPKADNKKGDQRGKALESELRRLKYENEKLSSKNNTEVSALLSERNFVWNQYKRMENDLTDQLRGKHAEVERANEKIEKLLTSMEQLQSSNTEKDDTIVTLKTNMAKMESDSLKKTEEISRLSGELELLRKSRSDSVTPVLRRCTAEPGTSQLEAKNNAINGRTISVKKEFYSSQVLEKSCRNSKRKSVDAASISETPKLFSSRFKVPKLKSPSPRVI